MISCMYIVRILNLGKQNDNSSSISCVKILKVHLHLGRSNDPEIPGWVELDPMARMAVSGLLSLKPLVMVLYKYHVC